MNAYFAINDFPRKVGTHAWQGGECGPPPLSVDGLGIRGGVAE